MSSLKNCSKNSPTAPAIFLDSQKGFTLLELLIAMMLMAVIITALFALFSNVIDASQHARKRMQTDKSGRAVLNILEDDLRYMLPDIKTTGLKFVANTQSSMFDEQKLLSFSTTSSLKFQKHENDLSLQYVTYSLQEQDDDTFKLIRTERPFPTVIGDFSELRYELVENVLECQFEYYNSEYNEFQSEWGVEKTNTPKAVRVRMTLGTPESSYEYVLTIPLPQEEV